MSSAESYDSRVRESVRNRARKSRSRSRVRGIRSSSESWDDVSLPRGGSPAPRSSHRRERRHHADLSRYRSGDRREQTAHSAQTERVPSNPAQMISGDNEAAMRRRLLDSINADGGTQWVFNPT